MHGFMVTWERVNDREAMAGGTNRYGIEARGVSLREACETVRRWAYTVSNTRGRYADSSEPQNARYVSFEMDDWETGDTLTLAIHFPESVTPSSRARLVRLLAA